MGDIIQEKSSSRFIRLETACNQIKAISTDGSAKKQLDGGMRRVHFKQNKLQGMTRQAGFLVESKDEEADIFSGHPENMGENTKNHLYPFGTTMYSTIGHLSARYVDLKAATRQGYLQ